MRSRKWQKIKQKKTCNRYLNKAQICTSTPRKSKEYYDCRRVFKDIQTTSSTSVESLNCPNKNYQKEETVYRDNKDRDHSDNEKKDKNVDDDLMYTGTPLTRSGNKLWQRKANECDQMKIRESMPSLEEQQLKKRLRVSEAIATPKNLRNNWVYKGNNGFPSNCPSGASIRSTSPTTSTGTSSDWRRASKAIPIYKRLYRRQKRESGPRPSIHVNSLTVRNQQQTILITSNYEQLCNRARKQRLEYLNQLRKVNYANQNDLLELSEQNAKMEKNQYCLENISMQQQYNHKRCTKNNLYKYQQCSQRRNHLRSHNHKKDNSFVKRSDRKLCGKLEKCNSQSLFRKSISRYLREDMKGQNFEFDNNWRTTDSDRSMISSNTSRLRFGQVLANKVSAAPFQVNNLDLEIRKCHAGKMYRQHRPLVNRSIFNILAERHNQNGQINSESVDDTTATFTIASAEAPTLINDLKIYQLPPRKSFVKSATKKSQSHRISCFTVYGGKFLYNRCLPYIDNMSYGRRTSTYLKNFNARRRSSILESNIECSRKYSNTVERKIKNRTIRNMGLDGNKKRLHSVNYKAITLMDLLQMWYQMDVTTRLIICLVTLSSFTALLSLALSLIST